MQGRERHAAPVGLGFSGEAQLHPGPEGNVRRRKLHRQRAALILGRKGDDGEIRVFLSAAFQTQLHLVACADVLALLLGHLCGKPPALAAVRQKQRRGFRSHLAGADIAGGYNTVRRSEDFSTGIAKRFQLLQLSAQLFIGDLTNLGTAAGALRQRGRFQRLAIGAQGVFQLGLGLLEIALCQCQSILQLLF